MSAPKQVKADHWLVVANNYWHKDTSFDTAIQRLIKDCGNRHGAALTVQVRRVDARAYVDELGTLYAARCIPKRTLVIPGPYFDKRDDLQEDWNEILDQWGVDYWEDEDETNVSE